MPTNFTGAESETFFAVALSITSGLGTANFPWHKINEFTAEKLFEMIDGKSRTTQHFIAADFPTLAIDAANAILEKARLENISITHYWSSSYPPILREISRPPLVLYYVGDLPKNEMQSVVGTRKPSDYSRGVTKKVAGLLVNDGYTIVSGMATGVDAIAHEAALESGGKTLAVLANGLGVVYPAANSRLYDLISKSPGSALVSEYPPGIHAGRWTFVRRNRIISGLSRAVMVIQAGSKSGTLITARYAAEQGRDVYVCPGNAFDDDFVGNHKLIADGAQILYDLNILSETLKETATGIQLDLFSNKPSGLSAIINKDGSIEDTILGYLANGTSDVDTVIRECGLQVHEFQEALVILEMDGRVIRKGNILSLG